MAVISELKARSKNLINIPDTPIFDVYYYNVTSPEVLEVANKLPRNETLYSNFDIEQAETGTGGGGQYRQIAFFSNSDTIGTLRKTGGTISDGEITMIRLYAYNSNYAQGQKITNIMISKSLEDIETYQPYYVNVTKYNNETIRNIKLDSLQFQLENNLFDKNNLVYENNYYYNDNGVKTSSSLSGYTDMKIAVEPNTSYYRLGTVTDKISFSAIYFYDADKNWISRLSLDAGINDTVFVTPENCYFIDLQYIIKSVDWDTIQIKKQLVDYHFAKNTLVTGKNLFDINSVELKNCEIVDNGIKFNGSGSFDIKLPAGTYTMSFKNNGVAPCWVRNGKVDSGYISQIQPTTTSVTFNFTADVDGYLRISCFTAGQILSDIQIESGETLTNYEQYSGTQSKRICEDAVEEPIYDMQIGGNSVQGKLPSEYQQVEYIQGTGTQWIDSGFIPNQDTRVVVDFQFTEFKATLLFGSRNTAGNKAYNVNVRGSKLFTSSYGGYGTIDFTDFDTNRHIVDKNKNLLYWDGELVITHTVHDFVCPETLEILASYDGTNGKGYLPAPAKIYSFKIYDNDILVRNYVPCYRKSDNEIGLYDLVNNTFSVNSGTETFLKGADTPTPDTPIEVESVGEKTKNLFDYSKWTNATKTTFNGVDCLKINDGAGYTYTINGDSSTEYMFTFKAYRNEADISKKTNLKTEDRNIVVNVTHDGTYSAVVYGGETIYFNGWGIALYLDLTVTQLEKGTEATPFEPYGYKVPIQISGKNLFGDLQSKWVSTSGEIYDNVGGRITQYIPCQEGDKFTLSATFEVEDASKNILLINFRSADDVSLGRYVVTKSTDLTITKTAPANTAYVVAGHYINQPIQIQFEKNSVATNYEPYFNKTTNIYLNEPLRKIGDYVDYIDYRNKKVVRNISTYTFNGTESAVLKYSTEEKYNYETQTKASSSILRTTPMCTHLKGVSGNMASTSIPLNHIRWSGYSGAYNLVVSQPTVDELKSWLAGLYNNGTPMIVYYVLKTPIEETIDITELSTEKGTNNFVVNTTLLPSEIKINYWKQI